MVCDRLLHSTYRCLRDYKWLSLLVSCIDLVGLGGGKLIDVIKIEVWSSTKSRWWEVS